jgi:hypothetical protein
MEYHAVYIHTWSTSMLVAPRTAVDPVALKAAAPAAFRAFFRIAAAWGLTGAQMRTLLGGPPASTFYKWKAGDVGGVNRDVLERVSYVLGIYKDLQILLPDPAAADAWVRRPNAAAPFGGSSALDRMLSGNVADLYHVRAYLDAERAGWP